MFLISYFYPDFDNACFILITMILMKNVFTCPFFYALTPLSTQFQLYYGEPVLVVEEAGASGENHRPWASNW
jgi:hypothetical protein